MKIKNLEEKTERNLELISSFCEHLKLHDIEVSDSIMVSFFEAD